VAVDFAALEHVDVVVADEEFGDGPAVVFFDPAFGLARGVGIGGCGLRFFGQSRVALRQRIAAEFDVHGHFEAMLVGRQAEHFHFADGGLAVIDDFVEVDDGAVEVFAVDRRREGFVEGVQVADLDAVGFVFVLADEPADGLVAGFHEFDEAPGGDADVLALLSEQREKVGHFGEDAVEQAANDRGAVFFAHGIFPRKR
jgi:hypothetical protein